MKKNFIIILILLGLFNTANAQKNAYGLSMGIAHSEIISEKLIGGPSWRMKTPFFIGFQYERKLIQHLSLQVGFNYYTNQLIAKSNFYPYSKEVESRYKMQLVHAPIFAKYTFWDYFFVNGGVIAEAGYSKEINNNLGFGAGLGIGFQYPVTKHLELQLNPYLNRYGFFIIGQEHKHLRRIMEAGVKMSILIK